MAVTDDKPKYWIMAPNGEKMPVSGALYKAVKEFTEHRLTGRIEIDYRDGGMCAARGLKQYAT
jgi:hypothetical protein